MAPRKDSWTDEEHNKLRELIKHNRNSYFNLARDAQEQNPPMFPGRTISSVIQQISIVKRLDRDGITMEQLNSRRRKK